MVNVAGYDKKNKKGITYPNLLSAIRPVPHGPDLPVPSPPDNVKFTQSEFNDLIRELQLTKEKSELLGSRLREKNMLAYRVKFSWYRNCEKGFRKYYAQED
jgi:hypothetical protein